MIAHLPLILKNSVRNKRRSILTTLSIAASMCLLGMLMAVYHAFYLSPATADQALRLVVRNKVSLGNPLPVSYQARIRGVRGVREVTIFQWFGGTYKDARDPANFFARFAVDPANFLAVYPDIDVQEDQRKAFLAERRSCLIGKKTAARHGFKLGDRITVTGDIFPVTLEFTVRGFFEAEGDNESLYFHYDYLNEALGAGSRRDYVGSFVVRLESAGDATPSSKAIDDMFRNAPFPTKTETEKAFEISFLAFLGNVKLFLFSICAAVTFTILLVAGNTMAMSVRERAREVGVLKTLGFTRGMVMSLLVGESLVLAVTGGVLGIALAEGLCSLIRQAPSTFANMSRIAVLPSLAALTLVAAAVIGLASSMIPAWSASRRSIVEALRVTD